MTPGSEAGPRTRDGGDMDIVDVILTDGRDCRLNSVGLPFGFELRPFGCELRPFGCELRPFGWCPAL